MDGSHQTFRTIYILLGSEVVRIFPLFSIVFGNDNIISCHMVSNLCVCGTEKLQTPPHLHHQPGSPVDQTRAYFPGTYGPVSPDPQHNNAKSSFGSLSTWPTSACPCHTPTTVQQAPRTLHPIRAAHI